MAGVWAGTGQTSSALLGSVIYQLCDLAKPQFPHL